MTYAIDSDLVAALHEGALETPPWAGFLDRLRRRSGADFAALIPQSGPLAADDVPPAFAATCPAGLRHHCIGLLAAGSAAAIASLRPARVYDGHDLAERGLAPPPAPPHDPLFTRVIRLETPAYGDVVLALARACGDFGADAGALLLALAPHCRIAVRTRAMLITPNRTIDGRSPAAAHATIEALTSDARGAALIDRYGLTAQESRLALALCRGRSLAEAAPTLGLTIETTRLYSKRIYAKTGTRGQADLVRLILTSPD